MTTSLQAQQKKSYQVGIIAFYNLENLFDTINQPEVNDEEFTPTGSNNYTGKVYLDKLGKLSDVLSLIGKDESPDGFSVLGCAEVENESVLKDLVNEPKLKSRNLKIVHYDSPDKRGVDVALLYNPKYFTPSLVSLCLLTYVLRKILNTTPVTFSMFLACIWASLSISSLVTGHHAEEAKRLLHHHVLRLLLYVKTKLIL